MIHSLSTHFITTARRAAIWAFLILGAAFGGTVLVMGIAGLITGRFAL